MVEKHLGKIGQWNCLVSQNIFGLRAKPTFDGVNLFIGPNSLFDRDILSQCHSWFKMPLMIHHKKSINVKCQFFVLCMPSFIGGYFFAFTSGLLKKILKMVAITYCLFAYWCSRPTIITKTLKCHISRPPSRWSQIMKFRTERLCKKCKIKHAVN